MVARNISVRLPEEAIDRVDALAKSLGRSRAWILNQATQRFLDYEEWFVEQVQAEMADARAGRVAAHEDLANVWREKRARLLD